MLGLLAEQGEADLESFFLVHNLQDQFNSPGKGWGRRKKVNTALAASRSRGDLAEILGAAVQRFGTTHPSDRENGAEDVSRADPRLIGLHETIRSASGQLYADGHLAEAIFAAYRAVEARVRRSSGLDDYGRSLMASAFNEREPVLVVSNSNNDEQEGFRFLFMGAMQGIRNPKAHDEIVQEDPDRAMDYLSFASLLMRRLDDAEAMLEQ